MKTVLANSVGIGPDGERYVHFPSRWSAVEEPSWYDHKKGWMTFYPFMLAYCSALLKRETDCEIKFLDGNLNNWNHETYLEKILSEKPEMLVMESSTLSFSLDIKLASKVKKKTGCRIVFAGQHPSAFPEDVLKAGADCVCIGEYEYAVLELLQGAEPSGIKGVFPNGRRELLDPNSLPWPEDEDVRRIDYIEPVVNEYRELELFASRGCSLACDFCVATNIYYGGAGSWRPRNVDDVTDEILAMKEKYDEMEGIFFDDELHNGRKDFIVELCKSIIAKNLDSLKYNAMCGYWNIDREMLEWMKKAGYYKLRVGIETADKSVAKSIGKSHSIKRLRSVLKEAKDVGIKIYGTFTYGASGSTPEKDRATTKLIKELLQKELLCDLQISICTPQPGTPFFSYANKLGSLENKSWKKFDGGRNVLQSYSGYLADEIEKVVLEARRVASIYGGSTRFRNADFSSVGMAVEGFGKILVIGSGPKWQTGKLLAEFGSAKMVYLLIREQLRRSFAGENVFTFGEGSLNKGTLSSETFTSLKNFRADLVIVQVNHNSEDLSGYSGVLSLAKRLSANVMGVDIGGKVIQPEKFSSGVSS